MIFILSIGSSYIFYRFGMRYLFKSKIIKTKYSAPLAYMLLMLSGASLAEYLSIAFLPQILRISFWNLIYLTTIIAITSGELIYYRNNKLVKRIITIEKNDIKFH